MYLYIFMLDGTIHRFCVRYVQSVRRIFRDLLSFQFYNEEEFITISSWNFIDFVVSLDLEEDIENSERLTYRFRSSEEMFSEDSGYSKLFRLGRGEEQTSLC